MLLHCYLSKNKRAKRQCDPRSPVPIPIHCQDEQLSYPLAIPHRYPKPFPSPIPISIPTESRRRTTSALPAAISRPALYLIDAAQRSSPPPTAALIPAAHGGTAPHRRYPRGRALHVALRMRASGRCRRLQYRGAASRGRCSAPQPRADGARAARPAHVTLPVAKGKERRRCTHRLRSDSTE